MIPVLLFPRANALHLEYMRSTNNAHRTKSAQRLRDPRRGPKNNNTRNLWPTYRRRSALLVAQGYHRINMHRPTRGYITGSECDEHQQQSNACECEWIARAHAEELVCHQMG